MSVRGSQAAQVGRRQVHRTAADPDVDARALDGVDAGARALPRHGAGVDAVDVLAMGDHAQAGAADRGARLRLALPDDIGDDRPGGDHEDVERRAGGHGGDAPRAPRPAASAGGGVAGLS